MLKSPGADLWNTGVSLEELQFYSNVCEINKLILDQWSAFTGVPYFKMPSK